MVHTALCGPGKISLPDTVDEELNKRLLEMFELTWLVSVNCYFDASIIENMKDASPVQRSGFQQIIPLKNFEQMVDHKLS